MKPTWQLQEAKNHFSEVVDEALIHGPQMVTRHGREVVVILSVEDYRRMQKPKNSLVEFLQVSPLAGADLDITRSRDFGRDIEL